MNVKLVAGACDHPRHGTVGAKQAALFLRNRTEGLERSLQPGTCATIRRCTRVGARRSQLWGESQLRRGTCLWAKRKESAVKEAVDDIDEDMRVGLNEVANEALRAMLSEDIQKLAEFKSKVDYFGEYLVGEGEMEAAKFMLVIKGLLEHQVPEEAETLEGSYKKAFEKIGSLLEDSGWQLMLPGQEPGDMDMIDDELIPPVLRPTQ